MDVNRAWSNVIKHEGEKFYTTRGLEFTYEVSSEPDGFKASRTDYFLSRRNFEKAFSLLPIKDTKTLGDNGIRGQSYVYALLTDSRIIMD
ncbi:hypothetical protein SAMN04487831_11738 [Pseudobutyrivibrio sp. UC1225]|uniref:hypothetical protein n=1 Tax=Pseudobutyrivibrio sp. UC1225 TaxID=1798185 RepID=UPI0008F03D02|nr:hypothetical protein [Pseudobutyrivibrio sp. UC1225]SFO29821.1 hypothetical protein SAMN04487831_11738 [Pseudobutyrivibrio sp. UC1225]